jgi:uracil DNA glycosylase
MKFVDIVPFSAGDKVIVLNTKKEHMILSVHPNPLSESYGYKLANGTMYWHHELKEVNAT